MVSSPTAGDVGATGTFAVQKTGKGWVLSWFLSRDGCCQQASNSHSAQRYPPTPGLPGDADAALQNIPPHTHADSWASRGVWETLSQSSPECRRTLDSPEKGSQLSVACSGNSRRDTSPVRVGKCHRLLWEYPSSPSSSCKPASLYPRQHLVEGITTPPPSFGCRSRRMFRTQAVQLLPFRSLQGYCLVGGRFRAWWYE